MKLAVLKAFCQFLDTVLHAEQSKADMEVNIAIAAAQQVASRRAAESRAQAAMMVEAVEDRAYEVRAMHQVACCQSHMTSATIIVCQHMAVDLRCLRRREAARHCMLACWRKHAKSITISCLVGRDRSPG